MDNNIKINALPFNAYLWAVAGLVAIGLAASIYLSISHFRVYTDIGYKSFCAVSRSINCDTVSQSPYSIFLGLPVSMWGIIGYTFYLLFLPFAWRTDAEKKKIWPLLFLVSLVYCIYSLILALISTYFVRSYCLMCILSYAVNFSLLFYTWLIRRRFSNESFYDGLKRDIDFLRIKGAQTAKYFLPAITVVILIWAFFPDYWHFESPILSQEIKQGITPEGHPWIGAENPRLDITEFSDYQCFQCKKMHYHLRNIINEHPETVRLIHRHYPMDHEYNWIVDNPFHVGSGDMALLAIYAAQEGKFWEMNDALFDLAGSGTISIKELANRTGLDFNDLSKAVNDPQMRHKLKVDIWQGMKSRINGTPAFVIAGKVHLGQIPPDILKSTVK